MESSEYTDNIGFHIDEVIVSDTTFINDCSISDCHVSTSVQTSCRGVLAYCASTRISQLVYKTASLCWLHAETSHTYTVILSAGYLFLSVLCVALTVTFKSLPSQKCVHVLLHEPFVYCMYLNILPSFNLNSSPLSRGHVFHYVLYIEVLFGGHMAYYK